MQVSPRGFIIKTDKTGHSSDWMDAGSVFTAPELRCEYEEAEVSTFTPSVTLIPSDFHIPGRAVSAGIFPARAVFPWPSAVHS